MAYGILDCFMISAVCGFVFGAVYEVLRIVRRTIRLKSVTFICDIVFFVAAAYFVLYLSLFLGNYIRIYTILGFGCGVFAYIQTLGRIISTVEGLLFLLIKNTVGAFLAAAFNAAKKIIGAFAQKTAKQFGKINDFSRNTIKKAASLLHFGSEKMYNSKREIMANGESSGGNNVITAKITRGS